MGVCTYYYSVQLQENNSISIFQCALVLSHSKKFASNGQSALELHPSSVWRTSTPTFCYNFIFKNGWRRIQDPPGRRLHRIEDKNRSFLIKIDCKIGFSLNLRISDLTKVWSPNTTDQLFGTRPRPNLFRPLWSCMTPEIFGTLNRTKISTPLISSTMV